MGKGSVSSKFLVTLNVIYSILGVATVGFSIYFFLSLTSVTSLRNENNFKFDSKIYWIQALPWIFIVSGIFVVLVSCCAFLGVMKKSRPLVLTNVTFQILTIVLLAVAATAAFKYSNTEETVEFINIVILDAFSYLKSGKPALTKAFEAMEINLQCCGSTGPSSYNGFSDSWVANYPSSCCKTYMEEPVGFCPKTDLVANTRRGCADVAIYYVRIAIKIFTAAAIVTAFIGLLNLVCAALLTNGLRNRKKAMKAKLISSEDKETLRSHVSSSEMETMKMGFKV